MGALSWVDDWKPDRASRDDTEKNPRRRGMIDDDCIVYQVAGRYLSISNSDPRVIPCMRS